MSLWLQVFLRIGCWKMSSKQTLLFGFSWLVPMGFKGGKERDWYENQHEPSPVDQIRSDPMGHFWGIGPNEFRNPLHLERSVTLKHWGPLQPTLCFHPVSGVLNGQIKPTSGEEQKIECGFDVAKGSANMPANILELYQCFWGYVVYSFQFKFFQSPQSPPTTKTAFKREGASHETSMGLRTWETWILLDTPMQHLLRCANQVTRSLTDDFQRLGEIAQTTDWGYWLNLSTCPKTPNWNGSILHSHDRS